MLLVTERGIGRWQGIEYDAAFDKHVGTIARTYGRRRDVMSGALRGLGLERLHFTPPKGGMFLWVTVPGIDTADLLEVSARQKVVFVPGVSFYPGRDVHDGMRLNFSNSTEEMIRTGIERLGHAIATFTR